MITFPEPKPRVAFLTTYHQPCGLAMYAEMLIRELRAQGCEVWVLAEQTPVTTKPDGDRVFRCWTRDNEGGKNVADMIGELGITLLHVNHGGIFPIDGWLIGVLSELRKRHVPVVTTFHTTETVSTQLAQIAELSDRVLVHFPENVLQLVALGAPRDRLEVVPLGMPPVQKKNLADAKTEIGWDPQQRVITAFGFVEPHKGILEVIEAMTYLREPFQLRLFIAGTAHPGNPASRPYLENCRKQAAALGLSDCVSFADYFLSDDEVMRYLQASDVIVMNYQSRRFEASAATAVALSSGRPVVSSSAPSFASSIPVTFKATSEWPLAIAIGFVLANPSISSVLLRNVAEYEQIAGWRVVAKRIREIYAGLSQRVTSAAGVAV